MQSNYYNPYNNFGFNNFIPQPMDMNQYFQQQMIRYPQMQFPSMYNHYQFTPQEMNMFPRNNH